MLRACIRRSPRSAERSTTPTALRPVSSVIASLVPAFGWIRPSIGYGGSGGCSSAADSRPNHPFRRRMPNEKNGQNVGKVIGIKGVVIDVAFTGQLPKIYNALRIDVPGGEQREASTLIAEVQQHLGDDRVRAVAMDSTDGLARGLDVEDTGGPISVPVGDLTLGRIWNVIGEPVDEKPASPDVERWSIHREPPAFRDLQPS